MTTALSRALRLSAVCLVLAVIMISASRLSRLTSWRYFLRPVPAKQIAEHGVIAGLVEADLLVSAILLALAILVVIVGVASVLLQLSRTHRPRGEGAPANGGESSGLPLLLAASMVFLAALAVAFTLTGSQLGRFTLVSVGLSASASDEIILKLGLDHSVVAAVVAGLACSATMAALVLGLLGRQSSAGPQLNNRPTSAWLHLFRLFSGIGVGVVTGMVLLRIRGALWGPRPASSITVLGGTGSIVKFWEAQDGIFQIVSLMPVALAAWALGWIVIGVALRLAGQWARLGLTTAGSWRCAVGLALALQITTLAACVLVPPTSNFRLSFSSEYARGHTATWFAVLDSWGVAFAASCIASGLIAVAGILARPRLNVAKGSGPTQLPDGGGEDPKKP